MSTQKPQNEIQRLETLHALQLLDTKPEERFDRITRVAQRIFGMQMTLINLVDDTRVWPKSAIGLPQQDIPRQDTMCNDTILEPEILVIPDMQKDDRYKDNPLVKNDPHLRSYAGVPITASDGTRPATFCIIDDKPREFSAADQQIMKDLASWVEMEINFADLQNALDQRKKVETELEKQLHDMGLLNAVAVERELKMVELKKQIDALSSQLESVQAK